MTYTFNIFKGSSDGSIHAAQTTRPALQADQVLIEITASGLCGTDEHQRHNDIALGHEGVGRVKELGPNVRELKVGDRVGWGYIHGSCGHCEQCLTGAETFCPDRQMYGQTTLDQGSFGDHAIWSESFLFRVPDGMSDEEAAPMMCGGATVFNALHYHNVQPTHRVGIVGVGGLGHLAIGFASKMGCDVVVFSGTDSKREEAMKLGASEFYAVKGVEELDIGKKIDFFLVTASAQVDWELYLPILAPGAVVLPLSVAEGNFVMPYMPIIQKGLRIQGSLVASRYVHQRMLHFADRHHIAPVLQRYPMTEEGITQAMKDLNEGKVRYRAVLIPQKA
ncbi:GroES-like protein [Microthyrium microscopicum]|uniref:GroES-like protein n=1 Tax=Microthyrium microscopicum TaxID=703497 RepID=A0A6A6U430_9PEZI|nr:GroES-like protein [Microthyrium microscopicum]